MIDLLVYNARIVTMNAAHEVIDGAYLAVRGSTIEAIAPMPRDPRELPTAVHTIDAHGCYLFPGLINTHTHSYQALLKGLACDKCLSEWLSSMAMPASCALTDEAAYYAGLVTALENIHSGVTTVIDMYPHTERHFYDKVMQAYRETGIDAIYAAGYLHDDNSEERLKNIEHNLVELLTENARTSGAPGASGASGASYPCMMLAPFQVWNNSAASLDMTQRLAEQYKVRVITHALETDYDRRASIARHGAGELQTLDAHGLLNNKLILTHGVTAQADEIERMVECGVNLSFTPVCNMYLGSGFAPAARMAKAGINLTLSTEGAACNNSNNMLETLKFAALSQKALCCDAAATTADDALAMATINAAKALGAESFLGTLEPGKRANFFLFDPLASAFSMPTHNPLSTLVYSSTPRNINAVVIGGKLVMEGGVISQVDEGAVLVRSQELAAALVKRAGIDQLQ